MAIKYQGRWLREICTSWSRRRKSAAGSVIVIDIATLFRSLNTGLYAQNEEFVEILDEEEKVRPD